ncbi:MAG: type II toxin-antitoxin system PemK/MazF family toxin [Deltaproteobacteria bacterium]|nr:type II toxin-antitoxin system PemK/MazF family toxin [Deltaproteobacteria bacterium]
MRRGDIFIAVVPGDYGKPRPVVIVQNETVNDTHASIVICPIWNQGPEEARHAGSQSHPSLSSHVTSCTSQKAGHCRR